MTIGRAPGASLVLADPSVSRVHARISADAVLEDAGSSHGTWLDGVRVTGPSPLRDGAKIRLGDAELRVERRRDAAEAGRDDRRAGGRFAARARDRRRRAPPATHFGMRPRVRAGYALSSSTRPRAGSAGCCGTWRAGTFLRLSDNDASLFQLLDGSHGAGRARSALRAALRDGRAGAAGAAAVGPRRARVPGGRRGRPAAGRAAHGPSEAAVQAAREGLPGLGAADRGALPARRLGALHAAGADRAGGADRRRDRVVRGADRRALRDAVRRRQQVRLGRAGVPVRALRGRGRARDSRTG